MGPWTKREDRSPTVVNQLVEYLKLAMVVTTIASGVFGVGYKLVSRVNAVPELQNDVAMLKRDVRKIKSQNRFVVRGMEKLTRTTFRDREDEPGEE